MLVNFFFGNSPWLSPGSLSALSELSPGLPADADFFGFLGGAPRPPPLLAILVKVVDHCRPVSSVVPSAASGVGGGTVPPCLACASRSPLSSRSLLGINFCFPFVVWRFRSSARSITTTSPGVNS